MNPIISVFISTLYSLSCNLFRHRTQTISQQSSLVSCLLRRGSRALIGSVRFETQWLLSSWTPGTWLATPVMTHTLTGVGGGKTSQWTFGDDYVRQFPKKA